MPSPILTSITATWTTGFSEEIWSKLGELKHGASKDGDVLILGPTLPDEADDRTANLAVLHRDAELRWGLTVEPRPASDPPAQVVEHDARLRGRKGLSALLLDGLTRGLPAVGAFRARYLVPEADFRCQVVPAVVQRGSAHEAALRLGEAHLDQVGYRFAGGVSGIEEIAIIYLHEQREYSLGISARGPLKLASPRWLPFADDIVEIVLSTFFLAEGRPV
jgi:hypothetical protein